MTGSGTYHTGNRGGSDLASGIVAKKFNPIKKGDGLAQISQSLDT